MKNLLRPIFPYRLRVLIHSLRKTIELNLITLRYRSLKKQTRFVPGETEFDGLKIKYLDGPSFWFMFQEIFIKEIYKLPIFSHDPYFIDGGANIGLASIYLKKRYPSATILAFEPDKKVFSFLESNLKCLSNSAEILLIQNGLWKEETTLNFFSEGSDGGRIKNDSDSENIISISTVRLSNFIDRRVDFLKLDIEGAEFEVLKEIESKLNLVDRIFIEYHSFVGQEQVLPELITILKKAGYRLNINTPGLISNCPFNSIQKYNGMDMQLNIFAFK